MSEPVGVMKCFECIEKHGRDMEHHLEDLVRVSKSPEERLRYEEWIDKVREIRRYAHQNARDISINPVLGRGPFALEELGEKPRVEVGEKVWVEHLMPSEECVPSSFRTIKPNPTHIITICCPKDGHMVEGRCTVGTRAVKIEHLHPKGEGSCPICGVA